MIMKGGEKMITENNLTLLSPCGRIGSSADTLCATSGLAFPTDGQGSVFQQLMALMAGSGQEQTSISEREVFETKGEDAEVLSEFTDESAFRSLSGLGIFGPNLSMNPAVQSREGSSQSCDGTSLQVEGVLVETPKQKGEQVTLNEEGMHESIASPVTLQEPVAGRIPISKTFGNENDTGVKSAVTAGASEESTAMVPEIQPDVGKADPVNKISAKETPLQSEPWDPEARPDRSRGNTIERTVFVMEDSGESRPVPEEDFRERSQVIPNSTRESRPAMGEIIEKINSIGAAHSSEGHSRASEISEEAGTEKTEEWIGEAVFSQEAKGAGPANTIDKPELCTQIKEEILDKLEQKGPSEFKLRLEPEELGEIDIKLKLSNGKLIIHIASANPKTQTLLAGQVDKLLLNMGLPNAQVEILQGAFQSNTQGQDAANTQNPAYSAHAGMDFSQRQQRDPLHRPWQNHPSRTGTGNALRQESALAVNGLLPGQPKISNRMDYTI